MNSEPFSNFGQPAQTEKLDRLRWRACHRQSVEGVHRASWRVVGLGKREVERSVSARIALIGVRSQLFWIFKEPVSDLYNTLVWLEPGCHPS